MDDDVNPRSLRSASEECVSSEGGPSLVIDSVGYSRAFYELFEGAIYLHRAQQYLVHKLDLYVKKAYCRPVNVGYYTRNKSKTVISVLKVLESNGPFRSGTKQVVSSLFDYEKIHLVR